MMKVFGKRAEDKRERRPDREKVSMKERLCRIRQWRPTWKTAALALGLVFIIVMMTVTFNNEYDKAGKYDYETLTNGGETTVGVINEQNPVTQEIPGREGDLGISIQFATYMRTNSGDVTITVTGKSTGTVYTEMKKAASEFGDNLYQDLLYTRPVAAEDDTLVIHVTATSEGDGVTIWATGGDALPEYSLQNGNGEMASDLIVSRIMSNNKAVFLRIVFFLKLLAVAISYLFIVRKVVKTEKMFMVLVLCLGFIYMLTMTPLSIPDEQTHYQSAYQLSNVFCFQWNDMEGGDAKHFDYSSLVGHVSVGSAYTRIVNDFFKPGEAYQRTEIPQAHNIGYPLMLVPQAVGITIGRIFNANFLITFYLARLCNLIFFAVCVYFAIKTTTRFKLLFGMVAIMPMTLHQAASCSYDVYINGMMLLLLAFIFRTIDGEGQIKWKEIIPLGIVAALLCPAKVVYSIGLLPLVLVPAKRFRNKKIFFGFLAGMCLLGMAAILVYQLPTLLSMASSVAGAGGAAMTNWEGGQNYTLSYIYHYPAQTFDVFWNSLRENGWLWLQQGVGRIFAGHSMWMEERPILFYILLLIIASFSYEEEKRMLSPVGRSVCFASAMGIILAVMLTMFLSWTSNTYSTIQGIQGRYFIPAFPLLFMFLNNKLVRLHQPVERYIACFGMLINLTMLTQALFTTLWV